MNTSSDFQVNGVVLQEKKQHVAIRFEIDNLNASNGLIDHINKIHF